MARDDLKRSLKLNERVPILHAKWDHRSPESTDRGFEVIWWNGAPFQSMWVDYLSQEDHRRECSRLFQSGFRPVSIDVSRMGGDSTPLYSSTWWIPLPEPESESMICLQHARRITALYMLGDSTKLADSITQQENPELRANLIDTFSRHNLPQSWLLEQLEDSSKPLSMRRACAQALALYPEKRMVPSEAMRFQDLIEQSPKNIEDPGLRSAIEAICIRWRMAVPNWQEAKDELRTRDGQRLVVLHPSSPFLRGSFANEPGRDRKKETLHPVQLRHSFALSDREITMEKFRKLLPELRTDQGFADYAKTEDSPAINVTYFDAAKYCRLLSELEGIAESDMCYPSVELINKDMILPANFMDRRGYRLPSESEFEYACRAGTLTARPFGYAKHLLTHYAWTFENANEIVHPVAQKLPNDFGFFDLLGNAFEWCQDAAIERYDGYEKYEWKPGEVRVDNPIHHAAPLSLARSIRGGAFLYQPSNARSGHRDFQAPLDRRVYLSFRIARTMIDQQ